MGHCGSAPDVAYEPIRWNQRETFRSTWMDTYVLATKTRDAFQI